MDTCIMDKLVIFPLFSSPETGDNIMKISGDRIGDRFHPIKPLSSTDVNPNFGIIGASVQDISLDININFPEAITW